MRTFSIAMWRWVITGMYCLVAVFGCNEVRFVNENGDGKTNVGFRYFPPKPFILVQTDTKGIRRATLISLPDVTKPHRVVHRSGWGTVDFKFKVNNGMITEFGENFDSKGPETIAAVTGGMTSLIGALGPFTAAVRHNVAGEVAFTVGPVNKAIVRLKLVATKLNHNDLQAARAQIASIETSLTNLKTLKIMESVDLFHQITVHQERVAEKLTDLRIEMAGLERIRDTKGVNNEVATKIDGALIPLSKAIGQLASYVRPKSSGIELYEIKALDGSMEFLPVALPTYK